MRRREEIYSAKCRCGARFVFRDFEQRTAHEAKITDYGIETRVFLRRLKAAGLSNREIAATIGTTSIWVMLQLRRNRDIET